MSSSTPHPFDPNYQRAAASSSFNHFLVYCDHQTPIARVTDGIYNAAQELQYFVIEFIDWDPGKQLLLPVHLAQVELATQRLYVPSLNRQQVLNTPAYHRNPAVQSGSVIAPTVNPTKMRSLEQSAPLEASAPLEGYSVAHPPIPPLTTGQPVPHTPMSPVAHPTPAVPPTPAQPAIAHPTAPVAKPTPHSHQTPPTRPPAEVTREEVIPLREERVVVDRTKQKIGEVVVRKEIETEMVQVPVQREKLIVEQVGADPKQLAEIDLTEEDSLSYPHRREAQLPPIPPQDR